MSIFRNENPNLGSVTTVNETALTSASMTATATSDLKPTTREIFNFPIVAATIAQYLWVAPWKCQIKAIRFIGGTVVANSTQTIQPVVTPVASQPAAPSSGTALTAAAIPVGSGSTANQPAAAALSATTSVLTLNPGDLIGMTISGALTALVGGVLQIEVAQIG